MTEGGEKSPTQVIFPESYEHASKEVKGLVGALYPAAFGKMQEAMKLLPKSSCKDLIEKQWDYICKTSISAVLEKFGGWEKECNDLVSVGHADARLVTLDTLIHNKDVFVYRLRQMRFID